MPEEGSVGDWEVAEAGCERLDGVAQDDEEWLQVSEGWIRLPRG